MKRNIIKMAFVAAFALVAGYGVYVSQNKEELSGLALENVEALAGSETNEQFNKIGCAAVMHNSLCRDNSGNLHSYATRY